MRDDASPDGTQSNSAEVIRTINAAIRARSDIVIRNSVAPSIGRTPGA
ncbi:hypothetical protein ACE7GA_25805 [Roseomonas sp. CCTCC AB2023176]